MTGGVGSVLLDQCGWQSVFYFSGGLTLFWVYYVYKYLLNEKGNCSHVASPSASSPLQLLGKHRLHKLFLGTANEHLFTSDRVPTGDQKNDSTQV